MTNPTIASGAAPKLYTAPAAPMVQAAITKGMPAATSAPAAVRAFDPASDPPKTEAEWVKTLELETKRNHDFLAKIKVDPTVAGYEQFLRHNLVLGDSH